MCTSWTLSLLSVLPLVLGRGLRSATSIPQSNEQQQCQTGWRQELQMFRQATLTRWKSADCYDFTFQRSCFCPWSDPVEISVRNGVVVSPVDETAFAPTMQSIFDEIYNTCYANCPLQGPYKCNVTYDSQGGYVEALYIDRFADMADEEMNYKVTNFAFCNATTVKQQQQQKRTNKPKHS